MFVFVIIILLNICEFLDRNGVEELEFVVFYFVGDWDDSVFIY